MQDNNENAEENQPLQQVNLRQSILNQDQNVVVVQDIQIIQQVNQNAQPSLQVEQFGQISQYQQGENQIPIPIQTQRMTPLQALQILFQNPIPDQTSFIHQFRSISPVVETCGGYNLEETTFLLPSIGQLQWEVQFQMPARLQEPKDPRKMADLLSRHIPQKAVTLNQDDCCREYFTNEHFFRQTTYNLTNQLVRIEFFGHVGKLYICGVLVLELVECNKNYSDLFQASKFSTMPQVIVYEPHYHQSRNLRNPIRIKAEKSNCPEHPYSLLGFQSIFGCCKLQRKFEVYGLKQGTCDILNRRTQANSCYSHMGCRDSYVCDFDCCNFPDYMTFEIKFNSVSQIDRLKILFALIHFNMYNKWEHTGYKGRHLLYQISRIQRKLNNDKCAIF